MFSGTEPSTAWLAAEWLGNPVWRWLLAALVWLATPLLLRRLLRFVATQVRRWAEGTATAYDDLVAELLHRVTWLTLAAVGAVAGLNILALPAGVREVLARILVALVWLQVGVWGSTALRWWLNRYERERGERDPAAKTTVGALRFLGRVLLWSTILLLVLDNLGIDVSALIAGLGIGGIAVGLAVQNILGDLFASFSILLDRPFVVGDFIVVDDLMGTVEYIGIKSTRLRSLSGEQIVLGNNDLLRSRIRNYKRMAERRVLFTFGVVYETPPEVLTRIPEWVREIVEGIEDLRFDRAHFKGFGPSSLDFEVVYYVLSADYNLYMDRQQRINLALLARFRAEGVAFAYPTQTIYLHQAAS